jgi:hypothetical protein
MRMQPNEIGAMQNMKVYKENEWLKEDDEITRATIKNGVITSLGVCRRNGDVASYSIWYSKPGKRDYRLEDDGTVSLVEDSEEKVVSKVKPSNIAIKNKKVVPFAKWFGDYVPVYNHTHKRKEDHIKGISIDGLEVMRDGTAKELRITKDYGTFKIDDVCLEAKDILLFTYGLSRDCLDPWGCHSYFNEDYDLIFDDDGKYEYNRGYNGDYFGKGKCGLESIGLAL